MARSTPPVAPAEHGEALRTVLRIKIAATLALWAGPLLISPPVLYAVLGIPRPVPAVFARLLGAAYAALTVVYLDGLGRLRSGEFPAVAVRTGIVSNGLAAVLLAVHGASGAWSGWPLRGRAFLWGSAVLTTLLALALLTFGRRAPRSPRAPRDSAPPPGT